MKLPPKVDIEPMQNIKDYFVNRATQHLDDSYMGIPMMKFPEDLRVYEHLLQRSKANVVIELGSLCGGSALWFRDHLLTFSHYAGFPNAYHVLSVDIDPERAISHVVRVDPEYAKDITFLSGDVCEAKTASLVKAELTSLGPCVPMIVEDSAHTYETTFAALENFSSLVPRGGFYVIEDGYLNVDNHVFLPKSRRREVIPAIRDWLKTPAGQKFKLCREYELYGVTSHPEGILCRQEN